MKPTSLITLLSTAGLLTMQSCSERDQAPAATTTTTTPVLATIAGEPLTESDLLAEARRLRDSGAPVPAAEPLLESLVDRRAAIFRALELGLDQQPDTRRRIENILIANLEQQQPASSTSQLEESVSESDLLAAYQQRIEEFTRPAKRRLAILRLKLPKLPSDAKLADLRKQMADARTRALSLPADERFFGSLATTFSDDSSSRTRQGDAGWFDAGRTGYRWPDSVIAAGFALDADGILSEVIECPGEALYLIKRCGSRPAETQPLAAVRQALVNQLRKTQKIARNHQLSRTNRAAAGVELFKSRLADIPWNSDAAVAGNKSTTPPSLPR